MIRADDMISLSRYVRKSGIRLTHEYSSDEKQNSSHEIPILKITPSRDDLAVQEGDSCQYDNQRQQSDGRLQSAITTCKLTTMVVSKEFCLHDEHNPTGRLGYNKWL